MDYALIDSGHGQKLERFGHLTLIRPCSFAFWAPRLSKDIWAKADGRFHRDGVKWENRKSKLPDHWVIELEKLQMIIKPTPFGHVGLFPEQIFLWKIIRESTHRSMRILNLFAYSGAMSLVAAQKGAQVCHVDSSHGMVEWARDNARLNGQDQIRWIVDDVYKFLNRLKNRGERFHGIILDPPSFGRGTRGEVFKIETDLPKILAACAHLLADNPAFIILSCHTPGYTPIVLHQLLQESIESKHSGTITSGELFLDGPFLLPSGAYALWKA